MFLAFKINIMKSMKIRTYFITFVTLAVLSCVFYSFKNPECDRQALLSKGVGLLKNFSFIQDYPFSFKKKKKDKAEFAKHVVTLNRGIRYKFFAVRSDEYEGQPVVSIFNNEKQDFIIASTYNEKFKRFYNEIEFECKATGNYCLTFHFLDGIEGCALGIFASNIKE